LYCQEREDTNQERKEGRYNMRTKLIKQKELEAKSRLQVLSKVFLVMTENELKREQNTDYRNKNDERKSLMDDSRTQVKYKTLNNTMLKDRFDAKVKIGN